MGIFDIFKKDSNNEKNNKEQRKINPILEIASIISNKDKEVIDKLSSCLLDTKRYFQENISFYQDRGIYEITEISKIKWIALVEILQEHNYVCERDWKDELEDFLYFSNRLNQMQANNLILKEEWFNPDDDISIWCEIIDENWSNIDMCMASIDIDSDSYVLFPSTTKDLNRLKNIANSINQRIELAQNM